MASFSGTVIGLSFLFGCVFLGLVAELSYFFWRKKRINNREIKENGTRYLAELSNMFCWKKPKSVISSNKQELNTTETNLDANGHEQEDLELGAGKDLLLKGYDEESVESELMRLHDLCGPPRFLFTINEETKEDLESDDGKSRGDRSRKGSRTRSLSDLILVADTPFLTPLSSPTLKAQPLDSYDRHGFNPLFESSTNAELNGLRSSPPPKFKFLRDAEEKLLRRLLEEAEKRARKNGGIFQDSVVKAPPNSSLETKVKDGSSIPVGTAVKDQGREVHHHLPLCNSTPSKVLPLVSSPSTFKPPDEKSVGDRSQ